MPDETHPPRSPLVAAKSVGSAPTPGSRSRRRLFSLLAAGTLGTPLALAGVVRLGLASDEDDAGDDDDGGHGRERGRDRGGHDDDAVAEDEAGGEADVDEAAADALPPVAEPPEAALVEIFDDDGFTPSHLTIDAGQTVAFVNYDGDDHTATGSGFDTGIIPEGGGMATVTLDTPGRYPYACLIHPEMVGEISVRDETGNVPERAAASPAPADAIPVRIVNFAFDPATINVATGETMVWTNEDSAPHTVTARNGAFDSGILDPGATFSWTFTQPGEVAYQCALHPAMTGTVVATGEPVAAVAATPEASPQASPLASPAGSTRDDARTVLIVDLAFEPQSLTVPAGSTVTWTNSGAAPHTVTGDEFSSDVLNSTQTFAHTFPDAGTFAYFCAIHPKMTGEIVVEPA